MRARKLTERQQEALGIIRRHLAKRGVPPSRSELAADLGLTNPAGADAHLVALARKGWIEVHAGVERGIQLLREGTPVLDPDELTVVPAGTPMAAVEPRGGQRLPNEIKAQFDTEPDCFLKVKGQSMSATGIQDGDIVALRYQSEASNGDLVIARIGDEITLKRITITREGRVRLEPESYDAGHEPIEIDAETEDWGVVGVVVGAILRNGPNRRREAEQHAGSTDGTNASGADQ